MNHQDTENKILGNLLKSPLESKSMNQLSTETGLSYVTVHKLTPFLLRRNLVRLEKKGKAHLISIDFEHADLEKISSAMLYEKNNFLKKYPQLFLVVRDLEEALAGRFYILLLFGSYAKEKIKKDSDIDLFFIVSSREEIENYKEKITNALKLHTKIRKDFKVVSTKDFMEMLDQKYTVGREAFKNNLVLFGTEHYYSLVKKYVRTKGY